MTDVYTLFQAVRDLPLPLLKWSEQITAEGDVDVRVVCQGLQGQQVHVRQILLREELALATVGPDVVLGLTRRQIVAAFRTAHPEGLPMGTRPL